MVSSEDRGESKHTPLGTPSSIYAVELFDSIPSTNDYLLNLASGIHPLHPYYSKNIACIAKEQTAGKGRRGRTWISSDHNIYFSLLWHFSCPSSQLSGLSIAVACAVVNTLLTLSPKPLDLKWPNDVFWEKQKLCGILIELTQKNHSTHKTSAVIGIGLNVCISESTRNRITQPCTDLKTLLHPLTLPDNTVITDKLLHHLEDALICFQTQGLRPFMEQWRTLDITFGKGVTLTTPTATVHGIGRGIDTEGKFLLELPSGELFHFIDGEISLQLDPETQSL